MVGEDRTLDGDKTLDVGMKPQMWGWNPRCGDETLDVGMEPQAVRTREWKWNVSHDDGWEH